MIEIVIVALGIVLDQLTKLWAVHALSGGTSIDIIKGVVSFTYTQNTGVAFGWLSGQSWIFFGITVPVMLVIIYVLIRYKSERIVSISLALILAGAFGNFIDRVALQYVRDFIYFEMINFPVFNTADSLVTIGGIMLGVKILFGKDPILSQKREIFGR